MIDHEMSYEEYVEAAKRMSEDLPIEKIAYYLEKTPEEITAMLKSSESGDDDNT